MKQHERTLEPRLEPETADRSRGATTQLYIGATEVNMTEFIDAWVQTIKTARDDGDLDTYVRKIFEEGVNIATEAVQENPEEYELRRIRTAIPPLGSKSREFANKQDAEEFLAGVLRDHRERVRLNTKSG